MTPFDYFQQLTLTDILVPGYIEQDQTAKPPHRFRAMCDAVYLQFDGGLVRCESVDQFNLLQVAVAEAVTPPYEIDEDDVFAVASLAFFTSMPYHEGVRVESFRGWREPDGAADEFLFKVAELRLSSEDVLFLDPMNPFGIQLGTATHRDRWLAAYAELAATLQPVTWTRR